jgi:3-isopropylmalate/(R)-2-methylmalate dehydratase small subunit
VISTSFADIFRNNALKNGLVPVALSSDGVARITSLLESDPAAVITVDLEAQQVRLPGGDALPFHVDPFARRMLLDGTDELGYLLSLEPAIEAYEAAHPPRVDTQAVRS